MRVSIEKGYHSPIQELMERLQTDDPKLAVHHIIGCWIAANSKPAQAIAPHVNNNFRFGRDYRISEGQQ